ncbi:MAG: phosphoribosylformylglycinamidine synthase, partial [Betaproteobacteria bacterium]
MSDILQIPGSSVLSSFRHERLLSKLQKLGLPVAEISARFEHYVWCGAPLAEEAKSKLVKLLDYGLAPARDDASPDALVLTVIPRLGTVSSWASKATDIAHNCGLNHVRRIERGIRYTLTPERGWLKSKSFDAGMLSKVADCLHDRMTETVVDVRFDSKSLFESLPGKAIRTVPVIARGRQALNEANQTLGLALSD